jgi:hypothetical protein
MTVTMKANRIHVFGGPEVILFEDVPRPTPGTGEVLVRVHAAGVGRGMPWYELGVAHYHSLCRSRSAQILRALSRRPPQAIALFPWATKCSGVTNPRFTGACANMLCNQLFGIIRAIAGARPQGYNVILAVSNIARIY